MSEEVVVKSVNKKPTREERLINRVKELEGENKEMRTALYHYRMILKEKSGNMKAVDSAMREIDETKDQIAYTMRRSPYI